MSNWCKEHSNRLYETDDILELQEWVDEYKSSWCRNQGIQMRIFTLRTTPESINEHYEVDKTLGVTEIHVPLIDINRVIPSRYNPFQTIPNDIVNYLKNKLNAPRLSVEKLLNFNIDISNNPYFNDDTEYNESRIKLLNNLTRWNKTYIDLNPNKMSVESYIIELISYLLFEPPPQIEQHDRGLMRTRALTAEALDYAWGEPIEKITDWVLDPIYQIAEHLGFSQEENVPKIPLEHIDAIGNELNDFLDRFMLTSDVSDGLTEAALFVFYFVQFIQRSVESRNTKYIRMYLGTAKEHVKNIRDVISGEGFIDVYYTGYFNQD